MQGDLFALLNLIATFFSLIGAALNQNASSRWSDHLIVSDFTNLITSKSADNYKYCANSQKGQVPSRKHSNKR